MASVSSIAAISSKPKNKAKARTKQDIITSYLRSQLDADTSVRVHCVIPSSDAYRVNWWVRDGYSNRITKSKFMRLVAVNNGIPDLQDLTQ